MGELSRNNAKHEEIAFHKHDSKFRWVDLWAAGPVAITSWTSEYTESGICGEAHLATPEKGRMIFDEAVKNLIAFTNEWMATPRSCG